MIKFQTQYIKENQHLNIEGSEQKLVANGMKNKHQRLVTDGAIGNWVTVTRSVIIIEDQCPNPVKPKSFN